MSEQHNTTENVQEIIKGMVRVEEYNAQFKQPNPNGRFPLCKPRLGKIVPFDVNGNYVQPISSEPMICERCGNVIDRSNHGPCPAVPPERRYGEDAQPKEAS